MKLKRRTRWVLSGVGLVLIGGIVLVFLAAMRPMLLSPFVASKLSAAIGGDVTIGGIVWLDGLDIELTDVSVQVPGVSGEAGEVIHVDRMSVRWSRVGIRFQIDDVVVQKATLRLIEQNAWGLTLEGLAPEHVEGGGRFPRVRLESLQVESGLLRDGRLIPAGEAVFVGGVEPLRDGSGGSSFTLREDGKGGASLKGVVSGDRDSLHVIATGISLSKQSQQLVPFHRVRNLAQQLELDGVIELEVDLQRGRASRASLWLEDMSIRLDPAVLGMEDEQSHEPFWQLFEGGRVVAKSEGMSPRLLVSSGFVEFIGDTFRIEGLEGTVESENRDGRIIDVPYRVDLEIRDLLDVGMMADLDEFEVAMKKAPFTLDVRAYDIQLEKGTGVIVPSEVADILKLFQVHQCDVERMELVFFRSSGGHEVSVEGNMQLLRGTGSYSKFPYPLHDLQADIELFNDEVIVQSLSARGSAKSTLSITGRVEASRGRDLEVHIQASDVPLDSILLYALPPRAEATLRDVFSKQHVGEPASDHVAYQHVDLDLTVTQDEEETLSIGGTIPFDDLQMTWREFPLTLDLEAGRLRWQDGRMHLETAGGNPVPAVSVQGGGRGTIGGSIFVPLGGGPSGGHIEFVIKNERIDADLLAAMSLVTDGRTEAMTTGGLTGFIDASGRIKIGHNSQGDESITHDVTVDIRNGSISVTPELDEMVGLSLDGPLGGRKLLDVEGTILLTEEGVKASPLWIRSGPIEAKLQGLVDGDDVLHVAASDLAVGDWLLEKLPDQLRRTLSGVWADWSPRGTFDVGIDIVDLPRRVGLIEVSAAEVRIGASQRLDLRDGLIVIADDDVEFNSIQLELTDGHGQRSTVEASGAVRELGQSGQMDIQADSLLLGLPLLTDLMLLLAGDEAEQTWRSLSPTGIAGLLAHWRAQDGESTWFINVAPSTAKMTWRDHRLSFRDVGGSRIRVVPGEILLETLHGDVGNERIDITGRIALDPMEVDIGGSVQGSLGGDLLVALAGPGWSHVLETIEFKDEGTSKAEALRVQLSEDENGAWSGTIDGQVMLQGAELTTGLRLENVAADVDVSISLLADQPMIDMGIRAASASIHGAMLKNVAGRIVSAPIEGAPDRIHIDELSAVFGDGHLVVDGHASDVDDSWSMQVTLTDARLSKLFPVAEPSDAEPSTGEVDAAMNLRGYVGDPEGMRGIGHFQVSRGHLRTLPSLVAVQQVLQLSSPVVGALSFVDVEFIIRGGVAVLEKIHLASGPWGGGGFSLDGSGTLTLDTMVVDARLRPRGSWPIIRDIIGVVQDQFYEVSMEGPIGHPEAGVIALPGLSPPQRSGE